MDTTILPSWQNSIIPDCRKDFENQIQNVWNHDVIDNPKNPENLSLQNVHQKKLFETMKHELNRLNSFKNKWPLDYLKPEDLAEAGFFYLQTEDRVQCAFCYIIIYSWSLGERALREHMKKSPRCPFLLSCDVGNVPLLHETRNTQSTSPKNCVQSPSFNQCKELCNISKSVSCKPKHPRMADIRRRLMTYKAWPLKSLNPQELAKCGLYYTGVSDVVTCFFCGGSLGNWEINDDPWIEHAKFFPHCAYLSLAKTGLHKTENSFHEHNISMKEDLKTATSYEEILDDTLVSDIMEEAFEIFPKSLVLDVSSQYTKRTGKKITSLHQLCEEVLEYKESQKKELQLEESEKERNRNLEQLTHEVSESSAGAAISKRETFLCKICMDQEMGVVFQPCGHLVSCLKCSREISNCPLCRRPITNVVRTYLS